MNLLNISLLTTFLLFFINLVVITVSRRFLTYKGVQFLSLINNSLFFVACLYLWPQYTIYGSTEVISWKLNSISWININYEILLKTSTLSYLFALLVSVIGLATNFYILNYFKFEERGEEFILLINWFEFSMIFLVLSNNFFSILLGWELIGLTSFLLINFWRFKTTTLGCSFKAFTFNKVSDIFLMIAFCLLWGSFKTSDIDVLLTLIQLNPTNHTNCIFISCICIFIASSIKSAQFLGHLWLPDSMEAPVPASSLIHSATLVSAGIYLLLKFQPLFSISNTMNFIFFYGSLTAAFGGIGAASQTDMKKLLAFSTISHCGFIIASISLNNFIVTVTYLYLHGLFKAVTFFCAGSIIKVSNSQDTRQMGMLKNQLVHTVMLIVAAINLGGLPFTYGYLYKYLFLYNLIITPVSYISYGFSIIGMLCGVVYVYKLIYYSCFDYRKGSYPVITLYLQLNKNLFKKLFFNFTYFKVIAFTIIYLFSIFFYIIIKYYILKNYIIINYSNTFHINEFLYLQNIINSKSYLVSIYYTLFTLVTLILILQNWRGSSSFSTKSNILISILGVLVFLMLINKLLLYCNIISCL